MSEPDQSAELDAWVQGTLAGAVAFARGLLRDPAAAEDVVHDCFCRLLRRGDVYDLPRDGTKLLYRAITNACINHTQRARRAGNLEDIEVPDGRAPTPPEEAAASELEAAVSRGLSRLSVMQRAAIELRALGHSLEDIADTLGLSASNAGVLLHRARKALAAELGAFLR